MSYNNKILLIKLIDMDQKGYVMSGLSFLLILPAILLVAVFVDMTTMGGESVGLVMQSDATFYAAKDMERNVDSLCVQVMRDAANEAIATRTPVSNSRTVVKDRLQAKMDAVAANYKTSIGADEVSCTILAVGQSRDTFKVQVNSTIYVKKGTSTHSETLSQDVSLLGESMPDPLPFIILKDYPCVTRDNESGRIFYGSALKDYLMENNKVNATAASVYINATSPLYVKDCPYEPYTIHGNTTDKEDNILILKNCLSNKYFHDSNDGACYFCRLEGQVTCSHMGIETFILPTGTNYQNTFAPVSIDHVLFSSSPYSGKGLLYSSSGDYLFLDNGHRQKYGLPTYLA